MLITCIVSCENIQNSLRSRPLLLTTFNAQRLPFLWDKGFRDVDLGRLQVLEHLGRRRRSARLGAGSQASDQVFLHWEILGLNMSHSHTQRRLIFAKHGASM